MRYIKSNNYWIYYIILKDFNKCSLVKLIGVYILPVSIQLLCFIHL